MTSKIYLLCIFTIFSFACGYAETVSFATIKDPAALLDNEIGRLDTLIQATQQSLEGQKKLREKIVEYQKIQDLYLAQPNDNDLLFKLIKSSYRTLESIKENHLMQTFDPDFINELTIISQAATKRGVPKP